MAAGSTRPYFKHSIAQLEEIFETGKTDATVVSALAGELKERSTDRAERLRQKVLEVEKQIVKAPPKAAPAASNPKAPAAKPRASQPHPAISPRPTNGTTRQTQSLPDLIEVSDLPSAPAPQTDNDPRSVLSAWIALEALSPQTYRRPEDLAAGDRSCVANFGDQLPWTRGERSRPKRQLYYQVMLGSIPMDRATEELVKAFGQDEERGQRQREKAAIAAILVDRNGIPVEENAIAVSSFAWALPLSLKLKLGSLGAWPRVEPKIVERLESIVRRTDKDGNPLPLDAATIDRAHRWIVAQFALPETLVEKPEFALRIYHYFKSKNPPEASLLNSFFIEDIAKASVLLESGTCPDGLRRYLGMQPPENAVDLLTDDSAIERVLAPAMMPATRWPSPGGHPLVMLQQAAVNIARSELAGKEGLIAVNGPPGTGKTTLLRDIVASCVLDRATAMTAFQTPENAFTASGERMMAGESAFFHMYRLADSLKGHEILVASSNNKAVENVSRELPAAKAIGRTSEELRYFRTVSDLVHSSDIADVDVAGDVEQIETWGLIAAVLGNAKNRFRFQQSFWWHDERGFRIYLKAAKGDPVEREIYDEKTGHLIEKRTPTIVREEKPPAPKDVAANWRKTRERFLFLKRSVEAEIAALEKVRVLCSEVVTLQTEIQNSEGKIGQLREEREKALDLRKQHAARVTTTSSAHKACEEDVRSHLHLKPGFFARLFQSGSWKSWSKDHADRLERMSKAGAKAVEARAHYDKAEKSVETLEQLALRFEEGRQANIVRLAEGEMKLAEMRQRLGKRIVDDAFFALSHDEKNLTAPWLDDSLHRKREDLFSAALDVHRAFIDASAQKVLHNLSVLMDIFTKGSPADEAKRGLLPDLWSTLFMVVPVLSTTFASVGRMLGDLPKESLGWLLIDEAGQALPQAAVGAIMRARRTIAVGDPLQIPPVVTLPDRLNAEICNYFRISRTRWAGPEGSVQTLSDAASPFQAAFRSDFGPRLVGIPLLVHRRCQEPMFGISNRIAYDSQMVHAPAQRDPGTVGAILGASTWFDVSAPADSKWCPAEGDIVVELMTRMAKAGVTNPDLFIITPFRIVAQELRRRLERETNLFAKLGIDLREWLTDRIGTIHTVQGREAESVILVLGAPAPSQGGARNWAGATPNIFNVAVSRAKQNLYVVGSYSAWSGVGHCREVAGIPKRKA